MAEYLQVDTDDWEKQIVTDYLEDTGLVVSDTVLNELYLVVSDLLKLYVNLAFDPEVNMSLLDKLNISVSTTETIAISLEIISTVTLDELFGDSLGRQHILDTLYVGLKAKTL